MDFTFNAGTFGSYPGIGPVPATDTSVTVPTGLDSGTVIATIAQPITQQYRIGLHLEAVRLDQAMAKEDLRKERQRVAAEVKTSYYQVSAIEAGVLALRDLVKAIEDVDGLTGALSRRGQGAALGGAGGEGPARAGAPAPRGLRERARRRSTST